RNADLRRQKLHKCARENWDFPNLHRSLRSDIGPSAESDRRQLLLPAAEAGGRCGVRPQEIRLAKPRNGPLHSFARGDVPVRAALQYVVALRRETRARGRHNCYLRRPKDNRQRGLELSSVTPDDGLLRENEELVLSLVDPRDGHAKPRGTRPRHGHPLLRDATGSSRGVSQVVCTSLPVAGGAAQRSHWGRSPSEACVQQIIYDVRSCRSMWPTWLSIPSARYRRRSRSAICHRR